MKLNLTRHQSDIVKGMAILGIVLHNFCHQLPDVVRENEFQYVAEHPRELWAHLCALHPYLPLDLCSFFGHYGVAVFVFVSGYGLVKKYEQTEQDTRVLPFLRYNLGKLWKLMIIPWTVYLAMDTFGYADRLRIGLTDIVAQLTLSINLFPQSLSQIQPGPYWYFGLTAELYIVYRLLFFRFRSRNLSVFIVLTSLFLQSAWLYRSHDTETAQWLEYFRYNATGWLLPFYMGIDAARHPWPLPDGKPMTALWLCVACLILFGGSFNPYIWLLLLALAALTAILCLRLLTGKFSHTLQWVGGFSSALFVAHPLLRPYWIHRAGDGHPYLFLLLYLVSAFVLATGFRLLMHILHKRLSKSTA